MKNLKDAKDLKIFPIRILQHVTDEDSLQLFQLMGNLF